MFHRPQTDDDGNAEDDFLYAYDHPIEDNACDKDEHVHDEGNCCECGSPYHCCCDCPAFRNGDTAGLSEDDLAWLEANWKYF